MKQNSRPTYYIPYEERINVWSHAAGLVLSFLAMCLLIKQASSEDTVWHWTGYLVYGMSQVAVFSASTFYHAAINEKKRRRLKIFDHAAIYFSIAGTYTPFALIVIRGPWGFFILSVIWIMALAGIVLKLFFTGRFRRLSTIGYVVMGWMMVLAIKPLLENMQVAGLLWIASGGILYTIGAVIYQARRIPYNHAVFHFFVLVGAVCHFVAVYVFAV